MSELLIACYLLSNRQLNPNSLPRCAHITVVTNAPNCSVNSHYFCLRVGFTCFEGALRYISAKIGRINDVAVAMSFLICKRRRCYSGDKYSRLSGADVAESEATSGGETGHLRNVN